MCSRRLIPRYEIIGRCHFQYSLSRKIESIIQRLIFSLSHLSYNIWRILCNASCRGAIVTARRKLVELARDTVELLKECGEEGIRSDEIATRLDTPKRRVYDVVAVLKAMGLVRTIRRFDGTTVTWIDVMKDFVPRSEYDAMKSTLDDVIDARNKLQIQVAELKEQLRVAKSRTRHETQLVESTSKTEYNTSTLTIRAISTKGFKSVTDSGLEVVIETHEPGMIVDPAEVERDERSELLKSLQRL